jgi:hypothetical protein
VFGLVERKQRTEEAQVGFRQPKHVSYAPAECGLGFELSKLDLGDVGSSDACPASEFARRESGAFSKAADRGADLVERPISKRWTQRHEGEGC